MALLGEKAIPNNQPLLFTATDAFDFCKCCCNSFEHRIILEKVDERQCDVTKIKKTSSRTKKRKRMLKRDMRAVPANNCRAHEGSLLHMA